MVRLRHAPRIALSGAATMVLLACSREHRDQSATDMAGSSFERDTLLARDTSGGRASLVVQAMDSSVPHQNTSPWIENSDSGPILHLPVVMQRALQRTFPRFHIWPWTAYSASARNHYHGSDQDGLRALVGDFNGDGRLDAALDGVDWLSFPSGNGEDIVTVTAVLTSGDTAIAVRITEGSLTSDDVPGAVRPHWLSLRSGFGRSTASPADAVAIVGPPNPTRVFNAVYVWVAERGRFLQWSYGE